MSDKQQKGDKWKDELLRSSLPLEQLVAEKLVKNSFHIAGEYQYIRPNEHNVNTEFSIDLHAYNVIVNSVQSAQDTRLNYLVECKYSYPGVRWVFSPLTQDPGWPVSIYELNRQESGPLCNLVQISNLNILVCTRGIVLHNDGVDPNAIPRGLNQLRYGMPNLVLQEANSIMSFRHGDSIGIPRDTRLKNSLICLMLVTTADLYVLKFAQSLETYYNAKSLDDVADKVDMLVVKQERGPHLQKYCEWLVNPGPPEKRDSSGLIKLWDELLPQEIQIFVVNFDKVDDIMSIIRNAFRYK